VSGLHPRTGTARLDPGPYGRYAFTLGESGTDADLDQQRHNLRSVQRGSAHKLAEPESRADCVWFVLLQARDFTHLPAASSNHAWVLELPCLPARGRKQRSSYESPGEAAFKELVTKE